MADVADGTTGEKFVHLHCHSEYSLLDGLSSTDAMAKAALEHGFKSLAITDHGTVGGLLSFQKSCKEKGIKAILGDEVYITADHNIKEKDTKTNHLILLAKNRKGLQNIMRLASIGEIEGKYRKPRIDFPLLQKYHEGIICLTACPAGELPNKVLSGDVAAAEKFVKDYKEIFGDDFYIEVMMHKYYPSGIEQENKERDIAKKLHRLAKKMEVKAVCTNDSHYAKKSDAKYHDILLSMQTGDHIKNPERFTFEGNDFYIKSYEEMLEIYKTAPEMLSNTVEIAEKVENKLMEFEPELLPHFPVPDGVKDDVAYLKSLVTDGMKSKGLMDKPEYRDRIKFEMGSIIKCGFVRYFLILWDIINFAKQTGIRVGVGRGSAVGCLCLYVLGVTKLDPMKYGLLFERFINPERVSPPDVDIDFDYYRRDEIYTYVYQKYGQDHCSKIGTYNSFKAKAVIRYAAKALDIGKDWDLYQAKKNKYPDQKHEMTKHSLDLADFISKSIPLGPNVTLESALKESNEFRQAIEKYPDLQDAALHIENTISSAGVHPAGIIICKDPITDHIAVRDSHDQICSQFDGPEVEELGLLKFDFLALKTLTVIEDTLKLIKERHPNKVKADFDIDKIEPTDPKVLSLFHGGQRNMDNRGIFQFEAFGISKLLKNIHVDSFEDLIVANALYRPGPLGAGVHDTYCDYKHGRQKVKLLHPKMGEILKDTYGIMVFQEDFMKVSQVLAGFTKGQSDILRKVVGKKKPELIKKEKLDEKFIAGCKANGIGEDVAKKIFEQIEFFGGYGFNKSHSAAYAFLAYQTAWLKINYGIEFMCNLLSSEIQNNDKDKKLNQYKDEARRMGIIIKPADLNKSKSKFKISKGRNSDGQECEFIRCPLTTVENVGEKAVQSIIENQPFTDIKDFLYRIDRRRVTSRVFSFLVQAGCMDECWHVARELLISQYEKIREEVDKGKAQKKKRDEYTKKMGGGSVFDRLGSSPIKL